MSVARPQSVAETQSRLRVLTGRRLKRPTLAPWMIMVLVGITAFLGLGFARTSLDNSAFELADLTTQLEVQDELNRELKLEIARMENPARIAPLAEEMGLIIPDETHQLLVDLSPDGPTVVEAETAEGNQ
jgi:hypothetical protein